MPRMDLLGQFAQATAIRVKGPPDAKSYPDPLPAPEAPKLSREGEQSRLRHHGDLHRIQKKLPRCRFSRVRRPCRLRPDRIFTFWPNLRPFVKVNRHGGVGERHQGLDYPGRHLTPIDRLTGQEDHAPARDRAQANLEAEADLRLSCCDFRGGLLASWVVSAGEIISAAAKAKTTIRLVVRSG